MWCAHTITHIRMHVVRDASVGWVRAGIALAAFANDQFI